MSQDFRIHKLQPQRSFCLYREFEWTSNTTHWHFTHFSPSLPFPFSVSQESQLPCQSSWAQRNLVNVCEFHKFVQIEQQQSLCPKKVKGLTPKFFYLTFCKHWMLSATLLSKCQNWKRWMGCDQQLTKVWLYKFANLFRLRFDKKHLIGDLLAFGKFLTPNCFVLQFWSSILFPFESSTQTPSYITCSFVSIIFLFSFCV